MWNTCLWSWMNQFTKQKLTLQSSIMTVKNILGKSCLVSLDWAVRVMQCDKNSKVVFCHTTPLLVRKQLVTRKPTQFWKQLSCHTIENVVKGILNKKMKILSSLTHLHDLRKIYPPETLRTHMRTLYFSEFLWDYTCHSFNVWMSCTEHIQSFSEILNDWLFHHDHSLSYGNMIIFCN